MTHTPKPPRITQFPPIQSQLDRPPNKWVNQKELGRLFGLSSGSIRNHLEALGLRTPKEAASAQAIESGLAKPIMRTQYGIPGGRGQVISGYRWNAEKIAPVLATRGLAPLSQVDTLIHSLADIIAREMRSVLADAQGRTGKSTENLEEKEILEELGKSQWTTDRARANLQLVPESALPSFLLRLKEVLVEKKVQEDHVDVFLEAVGYLHSLRECEMDQALEEAPERFSGHRPAQRF